MATTKSDGGIDIAWNGDTSLKDPGVNEAGESADIMIQNFIVKYTENGGVV